MLPHPSAHRRQGPDTWLTWHQHLFLLVHLLVNRERCNFLPAVKSSLTKNAAIQTPCWLYQGPKAFSFPSLGTAGQQVLCRFHGNVVLVEQQLPPKTNDGNCGGSAITLLPCKLHNSTRYEARLCAPALWQDCSATGGTCRALPSA